MSYPKIRFQGKKYLFIGTEHDLREGDGAIATKEAFECGECSYAHLMPDGRVMRFLKQIGTREEIELIGSGEAHPRPGAVANVFFSDTWNDPAAAIKKGPQP